MMLPQLSSSPMDSVTSSSAIEPSLPPDICLKSCDIVGNSGSNSELPVCSNATESWPGDMLQSSDQQQQRQQPDTSCGEGVTNMEVTEDSSGSTGIEQRVTVRADLLQSACSPGRSVEQEAGAVGGGLLPDLCEGASVASGPATSSSSPHRLLPEVCDHEPSETNTPSTESYHKALGAKPKVFKYKVGSKSRTDSDARSSSSGGGSSKSSIGKISSASNSISVKHATKLVNKRVGYDIQRTNESSHLSNNIYDTETVCTDSHSKMKSDMQFGESALTTNSKSLKVEPNSREEKASNDKSQATNESGDEITDGPAPDAGDSLGPTEGNATDRSDLEDADRLLQAADEKEQQAGDEKAVDDASPGLMEEYLLYDSRPISLVACGIWDCDSREVLPDATADEGDRDPGTSGGRTGLVLVRNNLHSASHPMFSKWPCEAYIPSHILVEVAFNSHGTSLGAAAGGGSLALYNTLSGGGGGAGGVAAGSEDVDALTRENDQVKLAKRMGLIHHLPQGTVDAGTSVRECVICMMDLIEGERVRYLPCMHLYHTHCIDDWFQRAFTCPSCLEPVDAALLNTYNTT